MIEKYLIAEFCEDGMEFPRLNCWGLVREIRRDIFGHYDLPSFSIHADDKKAITAAAHDVELGLLETSKPVAGAIASVWRLKLCWHVGACAVLNGKLGIIDISRGRGATWRSVKDFESRYGGVRYHL